MQILTGISHFKFKNGGQVLKWRRGDTSEDWRWKAYTSAVFSPLRATDGYRSPDSTYKKKLPKLPMPPFSLNSPVSPSSVGYIYIYIYTYIYLFIYIYIFVRVFKRRSCTKHFCNISQCHYVILYVCWKEQIPTNINTTLHHVALTESIVWRENQPYLLGVLTVANIELFY